MFNGMGGDTAKKRVALPANIGTPIASPLEDHDQNLFQRTRGRITSNSIERGSDFQTAFDSPGSIGGQSVSSAISARHACMGRSRVKP